TRRSSDLDVPGEVGLRLTVGRVVGGIGLAILMLAGAGFAQRYLSKQALAECLRPATVIMMPLAVACQPSNQTPPPNLMHIVEMQAAAYNLQLQKVVVCRSNQ